MTDREQYTPGPASGAEVRKDGESWTLILVRELRHSPTMVWQALTDPAQLSQWAPFECRSRPRCRGPRKALDGRDANAAGLRDDREARADGPKLL